MHAKLPMSNRDAVRLVFVLYRRTILDRLVCVADRGKQGSRVTRAQKQERVVFAIRKIFPTENVN